MRYKKKNVYPNLKKLGYTTDDLARLLGYKNGVSFRNTTGYNELMRAMETLVTEALSYREISDKDFLEYITKRLT